MSINARQQATPQDPALLSITEAFVELIVTSGYTPPLDDLAVDVLADALARFFTTTGIPVNPAVAGTRFAAIDQNDRYSRNAPRLTAADDSSDGAAK